ncbi:hypothetical protein TrRE_jg10844 [Triparma retinervis]|uniref:Protein phosphatase inhibitor 2 n=1 Tax=Triparma retinervis TaxID=2557542 RepID=A0A9W7A4F0_9STRA|nr:hypothetical protein TrRE_jg10844 [Triparma retinervis]
MKGLSNKTKTRRASKIEWDEETIALHDLDRGTRQKIDEPDTPFTTYTDEGESSEVHSSRFSLDDDLVSSSSLAPQSTSLARGLSEDMMIDGGAHGGVQPRSPSEADVPPRESGVSEGNMELLMGKLSDVANDESTPRKEDFGDKRANHYNEFEMLKRWREQHQDDDDEEDEGEE